jgi:TRAP-type mannitol/chloroaromatic compound transport system permease large subunit
MRAMAPKDISMRDIYGSILPFVLVMILALVIVMVFPEIALWLPNLVYAK